MTDAPPLRHLSIHGHPVAFRTAGTGPVVVLVHGMAGSSETWKHVIPALARRFTIVAPDLLGHGRSAKPRTEYSLGAHANLVRDLLAALGHERVTLVGQSLGGGVVMQLAYQYPERCERLVLVSSGGLGREVSPLLRGLSLPGVEQVFPLFCSPALRDAGRRVAAWLGRAALRTTPTAEEIWRAYASLAEDDARRAFFRTLRAVIDPGGQSVTANDRLYLAARVPTLIVWGREDALIPVHHGIAAHEAIPGSRLEIFDDAGHFPHCEAPARFVGTLVDFIDTTRPALTSEHEWRQLLRGPSITQAEGESP
ncbi:MAG TPA: alpha/beta fold hydrolase [Candidatus Eisenbacteria bacterium]|nr:alpha/beta fold hydrolase [Candidatus Eisenbacteria bacterium]